MYFGAMPSNGRETVLEFYGPSAWFGEITAFDELPRTLDASRERRDRTAASLTKCW
jgi:CRP-like cAMP-binding protein